MGQDAMADTGAELVSVDLRKCAEVVAVLARRAIPSATEENPSVFGLPSSALPNFYFLTVAPPDLAGGATPP